MATVYEERAKVFKALCDARPQSSLSYHMKILCESGIVTGRECGKWTYYQISPEGSQKALALLRKITTVNEADSDCNCCCK